MSQLILADRVWVIDLVTQDNEWYFGQFFHREKGVELGFGLWQTLVVFRVN